MYIKEEHIQRSNIDKVERKEIQSIAREAAEFVHKGGHPMDLPKALRIKE